MANRYLNDLPSVTPATGDQFLVGDTSNADTSSRCSYDALANAVGASLVAVYQPLDADLTAIAGLTSAADKGILFTGSGTATTFTITSAARTVLDDTTVAAMVDTLGGASSGGTGGLARLVSPTFTTPTIGVATATSVNSVVISGASTPTLAVTGTTTISGANTGDQNLFSTIAVSGQSNVVADSTSDTLTLVGSGVTITTNASTDTITFTVTAGGTGTVTSAAMTGVTGILSVAGSPITTTGTFALSLDKQAANTFLRGPTSGSNATPAFGTLVADDIPSLSSLYLPLSGGSISGNVTFTGGGTLDMDAGVISSIMTINGVSNVWTIDSEGAGVFGSTLKASNLSGTNTGDQNLFGTIAVSGQSNVVADSTSDTVTFVGATNVTITTNATTDTVTFTGPDLSGYLTSSTAASTYQPLDADLTAIAALTTTSFGRGLLTETNAASARGTLVVPTGSGSSTGTNTGDQTSVTGNAGTATALATARNINRVSFDGTAAINSGSPLTRTAVKTGNYSAAAGDLVPVDTTSGNVTITLPTTPAVGSMLAVKQIIRGGTNTVSVVCGGSDVFNRTSGGTTLTLTYTAQAAVLQYDTGIWTILADDLPASTFSTWAYSNLTFGDFNLPTVADGTYDWPGYAEIAGTYDLFHGIQTTAGTCTLAVKINGTAITGMSAVSVTSTPQNVTPSGALTVAVGDAVTVVISSTSSATRLRFSAKGTRTT